MNFAAPRTASPEKLGSPDELLLDELLLDELLLDELLFDELLLDELLLDELLLDELEPSPPQAVSIRPSIPITIIVRIIVIAPHLALAVNSFSASVMAAFSGPGEAILRRLHHHNRDAVRSNVEFFPVAKLRKNGESPQIKGGETNAPHMG